MVSKEISKEIPQEVIDKCREKLLRTKNGSLKPGSGSSE